MSETIATTITTTGRCLCGAVTATVTQLNPSVSACHCSMCRTWGGGPLLALECGTEVSFEGAGAITVFDSSAWAERGFCQYCGTHLFYRIKDSQAYFMPVGLFDRAALKPGTFHFTQQIFVDEQPDYYCFSNATKQLTGAEVFALYAPPESPEK